MALRQDKKQYSFKSVGNIYDKDVLEKSIPTPKPIGIKTPLQMNNNDNLFKMHYSLEDQVKDNLRNLIMTNNGERLGRYDYGANILPLVFELGSESADTTAMLRIKRAVSKYMPFVDLSGFATEINRNENKEAAKVEIYITYIIPRISNKEYGLKITLYAGG